jgi:hypothetical protein
MASSGGRSRAPQTEEEQRQHRPEREEALDADSVFAKLKSLKGDAGE